MSNINCKAWLKKKKIEKCCTRFHRSFYSSGEKKKNGSYIFLMTKYYRHIL